MPQQVTIALINRYLAGKATAEEQKFLEQWHAAMLMDKKGYEDIAGMDQMKRASWEQIAEHLREQQRPVVPVHRIHFLKTAWFKYAAAILIIFGAGTYLYITNQKEKPSVTQTSPVPVQNDVAPGGNKATLTLADGRKIILDSAKSGQLAREANATITKTAEGKIVYDPNEKLGDRILLNTMSTPRGGQYQLTLPDGSQVWLNAESSITYPTAFTGKERKVSITGEAYFEVRKDNTKPFKVNVEGKQEIEVLGTHFNINAYKEEPTISTTLLEGSVRLIARERFAQHVQPASGAANTVLTLKPGQQGQLTNQKLVLAKDPDIEQVMAWKNGRFLFGEKADINAIMKQISRWYDVDVEYRGKVDVHFGGSISRQVNVSKILGQLELTGSVKFSLEGRKIIVSP